MIKPKKMKEPITAQWGVSISDSDFKKLKAGYAAQSMDERWNFCTLKKEHVNGQGQQKTNIIRVHIGRSWTGIEHYILEIRPRDAHDMTSSGSAKIVCFTWESNPFAEGVTKRFTEEEAKETFVNVTRANLRCALDEFPAYGVDMRADGLFAHVEIGNTFPRLLGRGDADEDPGYDGVEECEEGFGVVYDSNEESNEVDYDESSHEDDANQGRSA